MTFRYPRLQLQLREPISGRFDCTAYAAAMLGDADSRGAHVFTGRQVRLATDEPRPDPASPGLNLRQTDEALYRLSHGAISVDTRWDEPWSNVASALRAGKWAELAIWREVLVDHGLGGGNRFAKGHAVIAGFDQDRVAFVLGDPLVDHWQDVAPAVLREAAAEELVRAGVGAPAGAFVSFSRDVYDAPPARPITYSVAFTTRSFFVYRVQAGRLKVLGRVARRFTHRTSAPCEAPRLVAWPSRHGNRRLVRVTAGVLAGAYVEPGASGISLEEHR